MHAEFSKVLSNWAHNVFSGYEITEIESYDELIEFYQICLEKHPKYQPLLVIDSIDQAFYTSGHAMDEWGVEQPTLSPKKYFNSLRVKKYFKSLHSCLKADLKQVELEQLHEEIMPVDSEEIALLDIIDNPKHMIKEGKALCFLVPTNDNKLAFLGMPQGKSGLRPAQVFTYIVLIENNFDVRFVGLGADLLYFTSKEPMTEEMANKLIEITSPFHYSVDSEEEARFAQALVGKTNLIIPHGTR